MLLRDGPLLKATFEEGQMLLSRKVVSVSFVSLKKVISDIFPLRRLQSEVRR
jgi:hypothetical protein